MQLPQIHRIITPLTDPLTEFTQKAPNKGKIAKELDIASLQPRPRIQTPKAAPSTTRPKAPARRRFRRLRRHNRHRHPARAAEDRGRRTRKLPSSTCRRSRAGATAADPDRAEAEADAGECGRPTAAGASGTKPSRDTEHVDVGRDSPEGALGIQRGPDGGRPGRRFGRIRRSR